MTKLKKDVKEVRDLLENLVELTIWMSGSSDFSREGQAYKGWMKGKPALDEALKYLTLEGRELMQ